MIIEIWQNASQFYLRRVKEVRLTKKVKEEIKEKLIEELNHKDLPNIIKIRGSEIKKMSFKEKIKYLENNYLSESDILFLDL